MIAMKPPHKFFERLLENDLDDLYISLENVLDKMLTGDVFNIPKDNISLSKHMGAPTVLGPYYNIFNFDHPGIKNLQYHLKEMTKEACIYYGHDYDSMEYMIHGWFNFDLKTEGTSKGVNPLKNDHFFHDHMGGEGAPVYHGYYCVYAEPSITYYKINNETIFENHNKNNRAIVSETGHPHGRDDWFDDKPRITIAYDISPLLSNVPKDLWISL